MYTHTIRSHRSDGTNERKNYDIRDFHRISKIFINSFFGFFIFYFLLFISTYKTVTYRLHATPTIVFHFYLRIFNTRLFLFFPSHCFFFFISTFTRLFAFPDRPINNKQQLTKSPTIQCIHGSILRTNPPRDPRQNQTAILKLIVRCTKGQSDVR